MSETQTLNALERMRRAQDQFRELSGFQAVSVSGMSKVDGGWEVDFDVVEVPRIPETTSLMATYRLIVDDAGEVSGYERIRRYSRSEVG